MPLLTFCGSVRSASPSISAISDQIFVSGHAASYSTLENWRNYTIIFKRRKNHERVVNNFCATRHHKIHLHTMRVMFHCKYRRLSLFTEQQVHGSIRSKERDQILHNSVLTHDEKIELAHENILDSVLNIADYLQTNNTRSMTAGNCYLIIYSFKTRSYN